MSDPPSPSPGEPPPAAPPPPGAAVPTPAFAVPAQPLQFVLPDYGGRPGLITAIGVLSIVIGSLSIIWSLVTVGQAGVYYMMSMVSTATAGARARATSVSTPPTVVLPPPAPGSPVGMSGSPVAVPGGATAMPTGPRGMNAKERAAAVAALSKARSMTPARKRHLDAILAAAGKDMRTDAVSESGTMEEMRSGETPPEYFLTPAGRLEVFNDRAVFYPTVNAPTLRVSAPPLGAPGADVTPEDETTPVAEAPEPGEEGDAVAGLVTGATTQPTSAPLVLAPGTPLTPAEAQSVVQQAQSLSSNGLNPAQVTSLTALLTVPGQQLVQAGAAQGSVLTCYAPAGQQAAIQFANGSSVSIGPQGNVTMMTAMPVMPTFTFRPVTLGLMVVTAVGSLALAVYLMVCGIMTLRQSPRARRLHLVFAAIKIPLAITAGLASAWVAQDLMSSVAGAGAPVGSTGYSLFSGIVPIVLGCAYPVALLIALNTKSVRDYYVAPADPGAPAVG